MRYAVFLDLLDGVPQLEARDYRQQNDSGSDNQTPAVTELVASDQETYTRNGKPADDHDSTVLRVSVEDPPQATDAGEEQPHTGKRDRLPHILAGVRGLLSVSGQIPSFH